MGSSYWFGPLTKNCLWPICYAFHQGVGNHDGQGRRPKENTIRTGTRVSRDASKFAQITDLYQFNWRRTASPAVSWPPRKISACFCVRSPLASGLSFVLSDSPSKAKGTIKEPAMKNERMEMIAPTDLSRFLSHISLMVQPAPLMMRAPTPNSPVYHKHSVSGAWDANEAIVIDQATHVL